MSATNPVFTLRNYLAQQAIDKANEGDFEMLEQLYEALKNPYEITDNNQDFLGMRPEWAKTKAGCSMLSCSS